MASHVSPQIFEQFQRMQKDSIEMTLEQQFEQRLTKEIEQALKDKTLSEHRKYIVEELLTLRCPVAGCRQAFLDFSGCFALVCCKFFFFFFFELKINIKKLFLFV